MDLFGLFRRRPPIRTIDDLADFIDQHAAFLVQKGIYEYSSARAGHYAKVLFAEPTFIEMADRARWQAYPLGLAMVGEAVEGVLRPQVGEDRRGALDRLIALVLSVFDRYPTPSSLRESAWREARRELAHRLDLVGLHPPKRAKDIPEPYVLSYFALIPIDEKLRRADLPALRGYLQVTLCNIHDELTERIHAPAIAATLHIGSH